MKKQFRAGVLAVGLVFGVAAAPAQSWWGKGAPDAAPTHTVTSNQSIWGTVWQYIFG